MQLGTPFIARHVPQLAMESLHFTIGGMTCDHCVRAVDARLRRTPGIDVTAVEIGSADLRYDPALTNVEDIADVIADEGNTAFEA